MLRSEVVQAFVTTSDQSVQSQDILRRLLERLDHLDLTGRLIAKYGIVQANHGGNGDIYWAYCKIKNTEVKVALKRLRFYIYKDDTFAKILAREIRVWSRLSHPNVLELLGYIIEENGFPSLISKWIANGTALEFVKVNPDADIQPLVVGIAEGLEYIHSQFVIHSDMKSDNVLISEDQKPLICDFGTSRLLATTQTVDGSSSSGKLRGSTRWLAPELFTDEQALHTKESDVWAFGMTVYELLAKKRPYYQFRIDAKVMYAVLEGLYPLKPVELNMGESGFKKLWTICISCWKKHAEGRPRMMEIIQFLRGEEDPVFSSSTSDNTPTPPAPYWQYQTGCLGESLPGLSSSEGNSSMFTSSQHYNPHASTSNSQELKFVMYEHNTESWRGETPKTRKKRRKVASATTVCGRCGAKSDCDSVDGFCNACPERQLRTRRPSAHPPRKPCDLCKRENVTCDKLPTCGLCLSLGLECKRKPLRRKARSLRLPELQPVMQEDPILGVQDTDAGGFGFMVDMRDPVPFGDSDLSSASTSRPSTGNSSSSSMRFTRRDEDELPCEIPELYIGTQVANTDKDNGVDAINTVEDWLVQQRNASS